jgi:iron complex outermembrane receptor protein
MRIAPSLLMRALTVGLVVTLRGRACAADAVPLAEIEVTAERIGEAEQHAPTAFVSVIDVATREAPIETAADVLSESVGVQVQRFGGLGAFSTVSIRGSSANQVPVYLDGIPLSQAQSQTVNLSDVPLDSLQRIDVYRGIIPVGFGGGGIGGVVNLVTRPPSAEPQTELSAGSGSFATRKVVATHTQRVGETDVLAHVSYLGSKGNFTYFDDNGTPENPTDDGTTTRINNAFNAVDALGKATRALGDDCFVDAVQEVFYKQQGVPGPGSVQFSTPSLEELRSLTYLRLRRTGLAGGAVDGAATLFGVYNLQEFDDPDGDFGVRQDTRNQTALAGGSLSGTWFAPYNQTLGWYGELDYEQFFPYNEFSAPLPQNGPDQTRLHLTLATQDEIALIPDRAVLVPSLRYDHFTDDFSGVNVANMPDTPPETSTLDLWTPSIGAQVRIASWLIVRGNIGRFQRAPSFSELFGNAGSVVGNANLKPETGINRDAGFVLTWPRAGWLDPGVLEYAYFHNNISDLIALEQASPTQFQPFNVGDARIVGSEVGLHAGALDHLGLEINYTHQNAQDLSVDSPEGNQLPLRPADELFVRPRVTGPWGSIYYEYTYLSANPTDADNFLIVPSRSIHTVGCALQPLPWLTARFEAVNLANADIRDLGDFPLPGLSFFGSLKVTF